MIGKIQQPLWKFSPTVFCIKVLVIFGLGRVTFQSESTFSGKAVISFLQGTMFLISAQLDIGSSSLAL